MIKEFFLFELSYRKGRSATYTFWGIAFFVGFLGVASSALRLGSPMGSIYANAPFLIFRMTLVASFALSMITSAIVSVAIIRDFDHRMDVVMFSMPIKKWDYLMGRFLGSFTILALINCGVFFGFIFGYALGKYMPWEVAWRGEELLSFAPWNYFYPFCVIMIPNLFFTSALFFMNGALWRNTTVIYAQGILFIVLYQISNNYLRELDSQYLAAIIDPFAIQTFLYETRYWTPAEQNTQFIPLNGVMLLNRLLWVGMGIVALVITYRFFSFTTRSQNPSRKKEESVTEVSAIRLVTSVRRKINFRSHLWQLAELSALYFKIVWREIPFLVIVGSGILLFFLTASKMTSTYGTSFYPVTSILIDQINRSFGLFLMIITVFYSGELVWKEHQINFNQISDALPTPDLIALISKFVSLVFTYIAVLVILIACGIVVQAFLHYYNFELNVYLKAFFIPVLMGLSSYTLLFIFIQVMSGNKFSGFVWCVAFVITNALLKQFGLERDLWQFESGALGIFSDMNSFGHFTIPFLWLKAHWISFALGLFLIAVIFYIRGTETAFHLRWKASRRRISRTLALLVFATASVFLFSGFYIFYKTSIVNQYQSPDDIKVLSAAYEKSLKKYQNMPQPKIVESNTTVELYPSKRSFTIEGYYYLKNKTDRSINLIHIQQNQDLHVRVEYLVFDRSSNIAEAYPDFHYTIYQVSPLLPGDSLKMNFKLSFTTKGFDDGRTNTDVVYNGTFITNSYFPGLGYNQQFELKNKDDRKKYSLPDKAHLSNPRDHGSTENALDRNADRIRFAIVTSTDSDQIAIAPGELVKEWKDKNRNWFHYKTDEPIPNSYSIISGRFNKKIDNWNNVRLEIYYHHDHKYNIDEMMKGMKDGLAYCSKRLSPFPYKQLKIVEFPRYTAGPTHAFTSMIPFSEGANFVLKKGHSDKDLNMPYFLTAREVARQWWGLQLMAGRMKGHSLLSDGLSQYTALMIMQQTVSPEMIEHFLKYELDTYLKGRTQEREKERPLETVEDQPYVSYNKASQALFTIQDYIGETAMDSALRTFYKDWSQRDNVYPGSKDLKQSILRVTPDSLLYLVHDLFETVTVYENKTREAFYREDKKGQYEITMSVSSEKLRFDSAGLGAKTPLNDWVDIGIYSLNADGKEKLVYLKKHQIKKEDTNIVITINSKPTRAGIDPMNKFPDRHSTDNTITVKEFVNISNLTVDFNQ